MTGHAALMFQPLSLRSVTVRNRIMVSPMCQYSAPDAVPTDWHFVHLGSRAVGGAGIVMAEATAVEPIGRITPFDVGLYSDVQEAAFKRIAAFVDDVGAVPGIQLAHAGRKASHGRPWERRAPLDTSHGGWPIVGPSAVPWSEGDLLPDELSPDRIAAIVDAFRVSARRARRAGFRVLEVHAAHGYLLHSFLSPLSNRRTDEYGGSLPNRARFLYETVAAIRQEWTDELPVFVRLSTTDWVPGGWEVDETVAVAAELRSLGVDLIDCSSGGSSPDQRITPFAGYQVEFASRVRRDAQVRTGAVGLLSDPGMAEDILQRGAADLVVLGRAMLWDPYWPHHAADVLGESVTLPVQYERSIIHSEQRRRRRAERNAESAATASETATSPVRGDAQVSW